MTDQNPYKPPADITDQESMGPVSRSSAQPTAKMVEYLSATRPWVLFLAILGFIGAGFAALATLGLLVMALSGMGQGPDVPSIGIALAYLPMVGVYVLFSVLLARYASAIGRLLNSGRTGDLEDALLKQKTFWKASGIMAIIGIGIALLALIAGAVLAVSAGLSGSGG